MFIITTRHSCAKTEINCHLQCNDHVHLITFVTCCNLIKCWLHGLINNRIKVVHCRLSESKSTEKIAVDEYLIILLGAKTTFSLQFTMSSLHLLLFLI